MSANPLYIGEIAPIFPRLEFIKGEPFTEFQPGQIYVLECWATWCGPCVATFPHLSALQQRYPEVTVLGAAVWEDDINSVRDFVREHDDEMRYSLAFNPTATADRPGDIPTEWLKPSWQEGIPTAFLIDQQGRIAWFGHPLDLDKPLAEVVAGTFDLSSAAADYRNWVAESMVAERTTLEKQLAELSARQDLAGAIVVCEAAFATTPELERVLGLEKLALQLRLGDGDAALDYARHLETTFGATSPTLRQELGYIIVDGIDAGPEMNEEAALLEVAATVLLLAERQAKAEENAMALCHAARSLTLVRFKQHQHQEAWQHAQDAITAAHKADLADDIITMLTELATQVREPMSDDSVKKKVACDGERCWIE
ncbi:hypothetical protein WM46_15325 [Citrobacter freundii complex sp. CFNIH2]|uniref:TlpA family protein disulfide reductase n=1 Tax=Citrobacter freundii complex sp. CFNIH2 TaxID=2066049 RepID=UPI000CA39C13|nr:TlpA disulfide reductase family protein [Citrobacter freundii complex sp. CFNIH2]AUO66017.1 hypothetical protein WM46_15325 [Citrobacter freundii complex sp. CFNIH2]